MNAQIQSLFISAPHVFHNVTGPSYIVVDNAHFPQDVKTSPFPVDPNVVDTQYADKQNPHALVSPQGYLLPFETSPEQQIQKEFWSLIGGVEAAVEHRYALTIWSQVFRELLYPGAGLPDGRTKQEEPKK